MRPTAIARGPLPPFPSGNYNKDLNLVWPAGVPQNDRRFLRANLWGVTIPGAPWVPGASTVHPERLLTWFIDRYGLDWQKRWLETYGGYGYRQFYLSCDDSMGPINNGSASPPGNAQSLDQYLETAARVKSFGLSPCHMLGSKYFNINRPSVQQYQDKYGPIIDALTRAGLADELVPAWEMDLWIADGQPCIDIIKWVGNKAHAAGALCPIHFSTGVTSWFKDGDPRGRYGFWDDIRGYCDALNYQADSNWTYDELQGRLNDTLIQQGGGIPGRPIQPWVYIRGFELKASAQFDGDHPNEDDGDQAGYVACCTVSPYGNAQVWGSGNGLRWPDGAQV